VPLTSLSYTFDPPTLKGSISNVFAQDEIALGRRLSVIIGSRFDHDFLSGWHLQPTAKALWKIGRSGQNLWASTSRAVRTPSPFDVAIQARLPLPPAPDGTPLMLGVIGDPDKGSEVHSDLETGYSVSLGSQATVKVTGFRSEYDRLVSLHPLTPRFELTPEPAHVLVLMQISNRGSAISKGLEIDGLWNPFRKVSLGASYTYLRNVGTIDSTLGDIPLPVEDVSPTHAWLVHAASPIAPRTEVSASLFRVGRNIPLAIPAYARADVRLEVKLRDWLSVVGTGQNLLQATHFEGAATSLASRTLIPRSATVALVWRPQQ
jgi:iron complex outermembrane receptor protein